MGSCDRTIAWTICATECGLLHISCYSHPHHFFPSRRFVHSTGVQSPSVERYRDTARSPPTNDPNRNFMQILITKFHCFNSKLFSGKIAIIFGRKIKFAERIRHRNCVGSSCENELWSRKEIIFAQKVMVTTPLTWAYDHIQTGNVWCVETYSLFACEDTHANNKWNRNNECWATTVLAKAQYWTLRESSIVSPKREWERKNAFFLL